MTGRLFIFDLLCLIFSVISCFSSLLNLFLIWDMQEWSGHILLLSLMTSYQFLYDISFYPSVISTPDSLAYKITLFFQFWGGISQSIITNEIALTVLCIIYFKKSFNVFKNITILLLAANIPSLFICANYLIYLNTGYEIANEIAQQGYTYIRLLSITVIFMTYVYTVYLVKRITPKISKPSFQVTAIKTLAERLKLYPLVNAITRFPFTYYQFRFGFSVDLETASQGIFISQCLIAVITPLVSVGYLMIFLLMQPRASKHLLHRLKTGKRLQVEISAVGIQGGEYDFDVQSNGNLDQFIEDADDISDTYLTKILDDDSSGYFSSGSDWKRFDYSTDSGVSFPLLLGDEESLRTNINM